MSAAGERAVVLSVLSLVLCAVSMGLSIYSMIREG